MDEIKTEETPTTLIEEPTKNRVKFSDVAKKVLESNKEEEKYDFENDPKVIEAKEKVKTKRQEIKDKLQKQYNSVYAEGSNLFENQYQFDVREKTKLYPLYKTSKDQEEARKAEIRKVLIFNGKVDENEVQQLHKQTYRDENLKNVANWKSVIGDKIYEAFSKHNLNKSDITQKMIDNVYLNIPKYKSDVKTKGNKVQMMYINVLVDDILNEKLYGPNFRQASKIRAVMKGKIARTKVAQMREKKEAQEAMIEEASSKIGAVLKGRIARKKVSTIKEKEKARAVDYVDNIIDDVVDKQVVDDAVNIQSAIRGAIARKNIIKVKQLRSLQEQPLDIPQGKSKATLLSQDTTAGEKGDIPRTVLIKVDEFFSNFVNKETPIKFENMKGSDALTLTQKRDTPIGVKAFANLYRYTNLYWDTKADGERLTLKQRLQNNNMNFNSKEDFLNTFNIDTRILTSDAIKAKASASKAGPSRRSKTKGD